MKDLEITVKVTVEELNYIVIALQELPYKVSAPIIDKVVKQSRNNTSEKE